MADSKFKFMLAAVTVVSIITIIVGYESQTYLLAFLKIWAEAQVLGLRLG